VTFEGKVEQIRLAPVSLQNVVTYTVVIGADNQLGRQPRGPAEALISDTTATVSAPTASAAGDRANRSATIWFHERGRLVSRHVRLGLSDAKFTEVTDGLEPGAHVVLRARVVTP
jgi:HlyD family secretion protein